MNKLLIIILFFCTLLPVHRANAKQCGDTFRFAEKLYKEGDFFRAAGEYKRFMFFSSNKKFMPYAAWRTGLCYLMGNRLDEAEKYLKEACFKAAFPEKKRFCFSLATLAWKRGDIPDAISMYSKFTGDPDLGKSAEFRLGVIYLQEHMFEDAIKKFETASTDESLRSRALELKELSIKLKNIPKPDPWRYAAASALLPGLGQAAAGRKPEALSSLLVVGMSVFGAVYGFKNDQRGFGILLTAIGSTFYLGNILNAANLAEKTYKRKVDPLIHKEIDSLSTDISERG